MIGRVDEETRSTGPDAKEKVRENYPRERPVRRCPSKETNKGQVLGRRMRYGILRLGHPSSPVSLHRSDSAEGPKREKDKLHKRGETAGESHGVAMLKSGKLGE